MTTDFSTLIPPSWQPLYDTLSCHLAMAYPKTTALCTPDFLATQTTHWQSLDQHSDRATTDWLIALFNTVFANQNTVLVRGGDEPEYLAAKDGKPAQICFAHGYFSSALHELAHWCIAGKQRRLLDDFGYWYCPDGRDAPTQRQFEALEIAPQAIECLFCLASGRKFFASADNLNANFDPHQSDFASLVYHRAAHHLACPTTLPKDAQKLLWLLIGLCQKVVL